MCGNTAASVVELSLAIQHTGRVDAIDLNLGCPQRSACRDFFGAFLMDHPSLVSDIVTAMVAALDIPVTCKIRLLPEYEDTLAFCRMLEAAGCSLVTVHGRRRERTHHEGPADWNQIAALKSALGIPVMGNGGVRSLQEGLERLNETGVDGIMAATGLLDNPYLFSASHPCQTKALIVSAAREYLDFVETYPPPNLKWMREHLRSLFVRLLRDTHTDLWTMLGHERIVTPDQGRELLKVIENRLGLADHLVLPLGRIKRNELRTCQGTEENDVCFDLWTE